MYEDFQGGFVYNTETLETALLVDTNKEITVVLMTPTKELLLF